MHYVCTDLEKNEKTSISSIDMKSFDGFNEVAKEYPYSFLEIQTVSQPNGNLIHNTFVRLPSPIDVNRLQDIMNIFFMN